MAPPEPMEKVTVLAPPVPTHSVAVRGHLPRRPAVDMERIFTLDYHNVSAEAAVEAAKRDARHIFGTDTDAEVVIDHVYISN